jgi:hypothetical protein
MVKESGLVRSRGSLQKGGQAVAVYYYADERRAVKGPFSAAEMRYFVRCSRVEMGTQVFDSLTQEWATLGRRVGENELGMGWPVP